MKLQSKVILVTGGSGFLGRVIVKKLLEKGAVVVTPRSETYNLERFEDALATVNRYRPDIVIHSAAFYGGLGINYDRPGEVYFKNMTMGTNIIEASYRGGVKKFVGIGTGCAYPNGIETPMNEERDFWSGPLHPSVTQYGGVKKMMQVQCEAYKKQYGFNGIHLVLTNLYGEWDSYNPARSHVVPALIRKFVEAQRNEESEVEIWGTGNPIREFLYVEDAAEGIILATELYDNVSPLNIVTGIQTTIRELVEYIKDILEYGGKIVWNTEKSDGQVIKCFDTTKMKKVLNWQPETDLYDGLKKTIKWFEENYDEAIKRW